MIRVSIVVGLVLLLCVACGVEPGSQVPAEPRVEPLVQEQGDIGSDTPLAEGAETSIPTAMPETEEQRRRRLLRESIDLRRQLAERGIPST